MSPPFTEDGTAKRPGEWENLVTFADKPPGSSDSERSHIEETDLTLEYDIGATSDASDESDERGYSISREKRRLTSLPVDEVQIIKQAVSRMMTIATEEAQGEEALYKSSGCWQAVAKSKRFENLTLSIISINACWIAYDTDYNKTAETLVDAPLQFQIGENFFCLYFTVELLIRFMSYRRKVDCRKDYWFVFDSALVVFMIAETWILTAVALVKGQGGGNPLGQTSILRLFRLLRLSRLLRMLRSLPELMILVKGMVTATASVMYVMGMLIILTYVFACAFTMLSDGYEFKEMFFSGVSHSMYSLMVYGTMLDDLAYFCDNIKAESRLTLCLVCLFVVMASMTFMNMLVGVLCEVVSAVAAAESEDASQSAVRASMHMVVESMGSSGVVSYDTFRLIMQSPTTLNCLLAAGIDPVVMVDFVDEFFADPDFEGSGKHRSMEFDEFVELVLNMRQSNMATMRDILQFWRNLKHKLSQQSGHVEAVLARYAKIEKQLKYREASLQERIASLLASIRDLAALQDDLGGPGGDSGGAKSYRPLEEERLPSNASVRKPIITIDADGKLTTDMERAFGGRTPDNAGTSSPNNITKTNTMSLFRERPGQAFSNQNNPKRRPGQALFDRDRPGQSNRCLSGEHQSRRGGEMGGCRAEPTTLTAAREWPAAAGLPGEMPRA
eukprot:TRINITY_DN17223_c0_g1_i1.p1 TRINITY_DN17223_c0_g1~~TRINITY_DN17223_c0_g1_i1.p1  ORF type:complete len:672 (+),score=154.13 TRINITY_DN17223_c0_g1_i1:285-2300(+)